MLEDMVKFIVVEELEYLEKLLRRATGKHDPLLRQLVMNALRSTTSYIGIIEEVEGIDRDWRTCTLQVFEKDFLKKARKYVKAYKKGVISIKEMRGLIQDALNDLFWEENHYYTYF